jgi:hypothetical protein
MYSSVWQNCGVIAAEIMSNNRIRRLALILIRRGAGTSVLLILHIL